MLYVYLSFRRYGGLPQIFSDCLFYGQNLVFLLYTINRKLVLLFEAELGGMCLSMWDMNMFLCQCYLLFTSC